MTHKFIEIKEGIYVEKLGNQLPLNEYTCIICNKRTTYLRPRIQMNAHANVFSVIEVTNRNYSYWTGYMRKMSELRNEVHSLLEMKTDKSLCSTSCFNKYISGYESDLVLFLAGLKCK